MAKIIDGKARAEEIRKQIKEKIEKRRAEGKKIPKLSVILVGDDPGSQVYVKGKEKACIEAGLLSETHRLSADTEEKTIINLVEKLNKDKNVDGILVQLPLPKQLNAERICDRILPEKDVDGLHPLNMGKLLRNEKPLFLPCTPSGVLDLILSTGTEIKGKEAVMVGRSNIVGKPVALLLLNEHATVTICHSRTRDLPAVCRRADILVAAIGKPKMIKGDWIKEGAVVIDVGMNRTEAGLVGDVDFDEAKKKAAFITPVPKGVGPMTIAMLLKNTLLSAERG